MRYILIQQIYYDRRKKRVEESMKVKDYFKEHKWIIPVAIAAGVLIITAIVIAVYSSGHFARGTKVNGIDVSGMSVKQLQKRSENIPLMSKNARLMRNPEMKVFLRKRSKEETSDWQSAMRSHYMIY